MRFAKWLFFAGLVGLNWGMYNLLQQREFLVFPWLDLPILGDLLRTPLTMYVVTQCTLLLLFLTALNRWHFYRWLSTTRAGELRNLAAGLQEKVEERKLLIERVQFLELADDDPHRIAIEAIALTKKNRDLAHERDTLRDKCHRLEVEVAAIQRLKTYLTEAWIDEDNAEVVAQLQQETARLRAVLDTSVSRERYEQLLVQHHELKGRHEALTERGIPAPPEKNSESVLAVVASTPLAEY